MKKILLINPPYKETIIREGRCQQKTLPFQTTYPPLTLATLAAILKSKYAVMIVDCIGDNLNLKELITTYSSYKPDIIFVATSTLSINSDISTAKTIYYSLPKSKPKIYLFGVHVSYFNNKIKENYFEIINGIPEKFAFSLINRQFDFKKIPLPYWEGVNLKKYRIPFRNRHFVVIKPSIGCPFECSFCVSSFYYGKKIINRPIKAIIDEIKHAKKLGISDVLFYSENFTLDREYVTELCKSIIKNRLNIKWVANSRVDYIDLKLLKIMKRAGCWMISYGIETPNYMILKKTGKDFSSEKILNTIRLTNKTGILSFGHFIFGLPGESKESIKNTVKFANMCKVDLAAFYIATPFPGSGIFEQFKKLDMQLEWDKFDYTNEIMTKGLKLTFWRTYAYLIFYSKLLLSPMRLFRLLKSCFF